MNATTIFKKSILYFLFLGAGFTSFGQQGIKWHTWYEGIAKAKQEQLPIVISIYNDDCTWCEHMSNTTYKDDRIINYFEKNFVAIKLNIEEKKPLHFKSKDYNFVSKGDRSFHALAVDLLDGRYGTPAVIFMDEKLEVLQSLIGYKESNKFLCILRYYGEGYYQKIPWHKFLECEGE